MSKTHTAIVFPSQGAKLQEQQVPTPAVGAGKVLVKVVYASPTPFDVWQGYHGLIVENWPLIISDSLTGIVSEVGPDVEHLKVGDQILSFTCGPSELHASQEYVLLAAERVGKVPPNVDLAAVTTIPNNLVTAIHSITHDLKLPVVIESSDKPLDEKSKNKRILIWGGGTSSGQYAVQILALSGYSNIIVTASSGHHNYLRSIGATQTVDYRSDKWQEELGGQVDLALDCVGDVEESLRKIGSVIKPTGDSIVAALLPLRAGGKKVTKIVMDLEEGVLPKEVKYIGVRTHFYEENEHYKKFLQSKIVPDLLASGKVKPNKVRIVTEGGNRLANYQKAIEDLENGTVSGEKLVIKIAH